MYQCSKCTSLPVIDSGTLVWKLSQYHRYLFIMFLYVSVTSIISFLQELIANFEEVGKQRGNLTCSELIRQQTHLKHSAYWPKLLLVRYHYHSYFCIVCFWTCWLGHVWARKFCASARYSWSKQTKCHVDKNVVQMVRTTTWTQRSVHTSHMPVMQNVIDQATWEVKLTQEPRADETEIEYKQWCNWAE